MLALILSGFAASLATPGQAQTKAPVSDADAAMAQKLLSGSLVPQTSRHSCAQSVRAGEIVVCAPDQNKYRIPSTADEDPTSRAGTRDGRLETPDVAGAGIFKGKATASGMCFVPPCPKPPSYIIDLSTIPEAPPGSDADKIAKGEMGVP